MLFHYGITGNLVEHVFVHIVDFICALPLPTLEQEYEEFCFGRVWLLATCIEGLFCNKIS